MDITKCFGDNCPIREHCIRFTAPMGEYRQSIFAEIHYDDDTKNCEYYWEEE